METILFTIFSVLCGCLLKYFFDKKFFLYKKEKEAKENLRNAISIFSQSRLLFSFLQRIDFEKLEKINDQEKLKRFGGDMRKFLEKDKIERLDPLRKINIYSTIKPYIDQEIWNIFKAYLKVYDHGHLICSSIACLEVLKKDSIVESVKKHIIPVVPKLKSFIEEDPFQHQFYVEDILFKKLIEVAEMN